MPALDGVAAGQPFGDRDYVGQFGRNDDQRARVKVRLEIGQRGKASLAGVALGGIPRVAKNLKSNRLSKLTE